MSEPTIKILHAALDDFKDETRETIVLRGRIDPSSFDLFKTGPYQREALPITPTSKLVTALGKGETIPDIEIGMRGQRFFEQGDAFILRDPCYIIDGLQRVTAARYMRAHHENLNIRMGALVHFNTSEEWERKRFEVLNGERTRVAASVMIRNLRHDSKLILTLYGLSHTDKDFALYQRVCWNQRFQRGDLINASVFIRVLLHLHASYTGAGQHSRAVLDRVRILEKSVGLQATRENAKRFFDIVDEAWGIRNITVDYPTPHLRAGFLMVLSDLFADHYNFWDENKRLSVSRDDVEKLRALNPSDPNIINLVGATGAARSLLYGIMRDHLNKGRTTNRLRERAA
jgi:hypothetical protein